MFWEIGFLLPLLSIVCTFYHLILVTLTLLWRNKGIRETHFLNIIGHSLIFMITQLHTSLAILLKSLCDFTYVSWHPLTIVKLLPPTYFTPLMFLHSIQFLSSNYIEYLGIKINTKIPTCDYLSSSISLPLCLAKSALYHQGSAESMHQCNDPAA